MCLLLCIRLDIFLMSHYTVSCATHKHVEAFKLFYHQCSAVFFFHLFALSSGEYFVYLYFQTVRYSYIYIYIVMWCHRIESSSLWKCIHFWNVNIYFIMPNMWNKSIENCCTQTNSLLRIQGRQKVSFDIFLLSVALVLSLSY